MQYEPQGLATAIPKLRAPGTQKRARRFAAVSKRGAGPWSPMGPGAAAGCGSSRSEARARPSVSLMVRLVHRRRRRRSEGPRSGARCAWAT